MGEGAGRVGEVGEVVARAGEGDRDAAVYHQEAGSETAGDLRQLGITRDRLHTHLCDLDELVVVVVAVEEGLPAEGQPRHHAAEAPHVQAVVIVLQVHQQLRALEVPRRDADVVLPAGVVELGEPPVDQPQLAAGVVDHDVVRLDVPVHDALRVAVVQRHADLVHVVAHVKVRQRGVQHLQVERGEGEDEREELSVRPGPSRVELWWVWVGRGRVGPALPTARARRAVRAREATRPKSAHPSAK